MNLFEGIGFENFRVFSNKSYFDFAPITIFTGTNNSGKSSVLNGIKLLQENFKDIKSTYQPITNMNLEGIMDTVIDTGSLLERYGTLKQFITNDSRENEFTFSFKKNMLIINDSVEIFYKIEISDNNIKNGIIKNISMVSKSTGKTIFEINLINPTNTSDLNILERHKLKLDFNYFFDETFLIINNSIEYFEALEAINLKLDELNQDLFPLKIFENLLDHFNKKYKVLFLCYSSADRGFGISMDPNFNYEESAFNIHTTRLNSILDEQNKLMGIYDFSILWSSELNNKIAFERQVLGYYNLPFEEAYAKLNEDILSFFSDIEWVLPFQNYHFESGVNFILNKSIETNGIGFKKFTELFTNYSRGPMQIGSTAILDAINIKEIYIKPTIEKNFKFYDAVFLPLLSFITNDHLDKASKDSYQDKICLNSPFDKLVTSKTEEFYSELIYKNINLIQTCLADLNMINFLPTHKIHNKRTYSLADNDEFTLLIKNLEGKNALTRGKAYEFINRWLKEFEIADSLIILHDVDTGNFKPYLRIGAKDVLMADFGYGTSQLIPLLLKIIPEDNPDHLIYGGVFQEHPFHSRVVVIEEPETNLHPALQSKLADLFVEANKKFNIQIIIETHSEYLIRKLQYLTGNGEIKPENTQLYYFHNCDKIPKGEKQIKKININKDGSITDDFGAGFFDEATSWKFELLKLNNPQKN